MSGGPQKRSENDSRRVPVMLPYPFPGPFDYLVPPELTVAPGDVVLVPLNRREEVGVVWDAPPDRAVPDHKLKPLIGVLDTPPMREDLRRFIDWIASYTLSPPGEVMAMALRVARPAPLPTSGWQRIAPAPVGVRMTPARERVLAVLARAEPRGTGELARAAEVGTAVIRGMEQAGLLASVPIPAAPPFAQPDLDAGRPLLSEDQEQAAATLRQAVAERSFSVTLLDGVTGSGKTEVYLEAVAECLRQGRQALVLLPEIALSSQWLERFTRRFGVAPAVWHSDLTSRVRRTTWRAVAEGGA
ncbi:MAG: DEAD/DEAH box helicase family protein, partial [Rhodospirillales bacterium]|nr:DEAD/DEAH box helicase family protein [Rhodospirillales bacterium]